MGNLGTFRALQQVGSLSRLHLFYNGNRLFVNWQF